MFRIEVNVITGEKKQIDLTPEEVAEAQERTRLEKEAADNKPDKKKELSDEIDKAKDLDDLKAIIKKMIK